MQADDFAFTAVSQISVVHHHSQTFGTDCLKKRKEKKRKETKIKDRQINGTRSK